MSISSEKIIKHFLNLSEKYFEKSEVTRGTAFKNSAEVIKTYYPNFLPDDLSDLQKLKGFGGSSYKEVIDFIENENTPRLIGLLKNNEDLKKSESSISKLKSILKRN